jgi:predicted 3-demethylubiquinone-9 3-methyltransferase (glyoxalase superfamily)
MPLPDATKLMKNKITQKITPFLWFNDNAEEAANFYVSLFANSRILAVTRYGEMGPRPKGSVMTVNFQLEGQKFVALNGGPQFKFTEAISFVVNCETQAEIDHFWDRLSEGGETSRCGWLNDKFGLTWQIVPAALAEMLADENSERTGRMMAALMQMAKLDLAALQQAYDED